MSLPPPRSVSHLVVLREPGFVLGDAGGVVTAKPTSIPLAVWGYSPFERENKIFYLGNSHPRFSFACWMVLGGGVDVYNLFFRGPGIVCFVCVNTSFDLSGRLFESVLQAGSFLTPASCFLRLQVHGEERGKQVSPLCECLPGSKHLADGREGEMCATNQKAAWAQAWARRLSSALEGGGETGSSPSICCGMPAFGTKIPSANHRLLWDSSTAACCRISFLGSATH